MIKTYDKFLTFLQKDIKLDSYVYFMDKLNLEKKKLNDLIFDYSGFFSCLTLFGVLLLTPLSFYATSTISVSAFMFSLLITEIVKQQVTPMEPLWLTPKIKSLYKEKEQLDQKMQQALQLKDNQNYLLNSLETMISILNERSEQKIYFEHCEIQKSYQQLILAFRDDDFQTAVNLLTNLKSSLLTCALYLVNHEKTIDEPLKEMSIGGMSYDALLEYYNKNENKLKIAQHYKKVL